MKPHACPESDLLFKWMDELTKINSTIEEIKETDLVQTPNEMREKLQRVLLRLPHLINCPRKTHSDTLVYTREVDVNVADTIIHAAVRGSQTWLVDFALKNANSLPIDWEYKNALGLSIFWQLLETLPVKNIFRKNAQTMVHLSPKLVNCLNRSHGTVGKGQSPLTWCIRYDFDMAHFLVNDPVAGAAVDLSLREERDGKSGDSPVDILKKVVRKKKFQESAVLKSHETSVEEQKKGNVARRRRSSMSRHRGLGSTLTPHQESHGTKGSWEALLNQISRLAERHRRSYLLPLDMRVLLYLNKDVAQMYAERATLDTNTIHTLIQRNAFKSES
jgi:hypothetical protein